MKMNKSILTGMTALSLFATSAAVSMSILATAGKVVANENISAHADDQVNTTQTATDNKTQNTSNNQVSTQANSDPDQDTNSSDITDGNTPDDSITEEVIPPNAEENAQKEAASEQYIRNMNKRALGPTPKYSSPYKNKDYQYIVKHKKNVTKYFLSRMSKKFKKGTKHVKIKTFYVKQRAYMTQYLTIKAMKLGSTKHIHYIPTNNKKKAHFIIDYTDTTGYSYNPLHYTVLLQADIFLARAKQDNNYLPKFSKVLILGTKPY
ncbi:hypothetical protein LAKU_6c00200 [Apilactobacillus kunkeei EFB6]|uniref:Uncharacterized protein n=1 Tax=Apilactobacillus kunkeei EFB6 TaxID=1419324 RepID=A0A837ADV4_9LACO|nr:hypothetical protein [Apilactobacillus kunkeei]KDB01162.1 hypothetical protein LAKU_6c00200 [Apilactobacillus kunkeei EFB6]